MLQRLTPASPRCRPAISYLAILQHLIHISMHSHLVDKYFGQHCIQLGRVCRGKMRHWFVGAWTPTTENDMPLPRPRTKASAMWTTLPTELDKVLLIDASR